MKIAKLSLLLLAGLLASCPVAVAQQQSEAEKGYRGPATTVTPNRQLDSAPREYVRVHRDKRGTSLALETAVVRCVPRDCSMDWPSVDLIAAVHIGERAYYEQLNRLFRKYDVVLFEIVAPEGTRIPRGGGSRSGGPVSSLQIAMKNMLELEFQLEQIDYTQPNLVHADMSPEAFAASMRRKGESPVGMFLRMVGYALSQQQASETSDADFLGAMFDKNRALALKRIMAEEFEGVGGSMQAFEGPGGSTLISERNKVALDVLREQIRAGRKRIAIFYGAAHMPDFETRLREGFELTPISTRWITAWDLRDEP